MCDVPATHPNRNLQVSQHLGASLGTQLTLLAYRLCSMPVHSALACCEAGRVVAHGQTQLHHYVADFCARVPAVGVAASGWHHVLHAEHQDCNVQNTVMNDVNA
jgi:hypothetical protein